MYKDCNKMHRQQNIKKSFILFRTLYSNILCCDEYLTKHEPMTFLSGFNHFSETFKFMKFHEIPSICFQLITSGMYAPVLIASP